MADLKLERKYFDEDTWGPVSLEEAKKVMGNFYRDWAPVRKVLHDGFTVTTAAAEYRVRRKETKT